MLKKALIVVSIIAGILAIVVTYLWAGNINREEIHRAELEMQQLRASRDSIKAVVAFKDSLQSLMHAQLKELQVQTDLLRNQVEQLEKARAREQLTVRSIRKKGELQKKFLNTFPELAHSDWGVTEVLNKENGITIKYLLVPLWFSETFIIDHQNAILYKKQRDKLILVDSLQQQVSILKDSLLVLEQQKAEAYRNGYAAAFTKYEALNDKYIRVLRKPPKIEWGLPQWGVVAAGVAAGVFIGTQVGN